MRLQRRDGLDGHCAPRTGSSALRGPFESSGAIAGLLAVGGRSGTLPVRPFNEALLGPFAQHTGFGWKNLGVLLAWGAVGALVAVRRFRRNPRPQ